MPVKVCHVCSGHHDDDARVFERECVSLAEAGYDVHLLANSEERQPYSRGGVTIHPVPSFSSRRERIARRGCVAEMAADLRPDVYHVHEPELLGPVLSRAEGRPVVWDVHEAYLDEIRAKGWVPQLLRPIAGLAWDRLERSMVRRCAAVVAATQWLATRYLGMNQRTVVAANFPRLPGHIESAPLPRRANSLVFTGTIAPNRGVMDTIEAMAILERRGKVVSLDLAGTPETPGYIDELLQVATSLGIRKKITWHGHLRLDETRQLQRTCGIGMAVHLPSEGNLFGYPVKMFEFMMHGLPLVYSDLPTFRLVAGEGDAGIAVAPSQPEQIADAIEKLLADPALARRLGENGRRAIHDRFNWDAEWPKLRDLYLQLV